MPCNSCGNSTGSYSNNGNSCCGNKKPMDTNKALKQIQNGDENFCFNEVTDEICKNLVSNEGIHPSAKHSNNDCDDLKSLNDLGMGDMHNRLIALDLCNMNDLKCWLFALISWIWNINKAIICAICGLWCVVDKLKKVILDNAYKNIRTVGSYVVEQETPEMSVTVNQDGSFIYKWSDWNTDLKTKFGSGVLTGKLNFDMSSNSEGGLNYSINSIRLDSVQYQTTGVDSGVVRNPIYSILIPSNGTKVWEHEGNVKTNWTQTINKTVNYKQSGKINPRSESAWIDFMTWGANWVIDDRVQLRFKFVNDNDKIDLGNC